jgi:hypothetical protein
MTQCQGRLCGQAITLPDDYLSSWYSTNFTTSTATSRNTTRLLNTRLLLRDGMTTLPVGFKTESANDLLDTAALTMLGHVPLLADSEKYISASGLALNHSVQSTSNISLSALTRSPRSSISTFHEIDLRDSRLYAISTICKPQFEVCERSTSLALYCGIFEGSGHIHVARRTQALCSSRMPKSS